MKKLLFAALYLSAFSVVTFLSAGCGSSEVRTVPPLAGEHKQSFKDAIQSNPNIPDAAKKKFQ